MINLYLDTNVYLTFFHLTSDDLEELKKLLVILTNTKDVRLILPEQTRDEFNRNRETKIADALKRFKEEKLNNQFPQFCKGYKEYQDMRNAIIVFDQKKSELLTKLLVDIEKRNLAADKLIKSLFKKAEMCPITEELLTLAKMRFDLGRPPGKNKSYGDAINWETLLQVVSEEEDLYFISDDKDYYSEIESNSFNSYLLEEWSDKKESELFYYRRISDFFSDKFPGIKIASEYEKDIIIAKLSSSKNFSQTHNVLSRLITFDEFSTTQFSDIVNAMIDNPQIYRIREDSDIQNFVKKWIMPNKKLVDATTWDAFNDIYK